MFGDPNLVINFFVSRFAWAFISKSIFGVIITSGCFQITLIIKIGAALIDICTRCSVTYPSVITTTGKTSKGVHACRMLMTIVFMVCIVSGATLVHIMTGFVFFINFVKSIAARTIVTKNGSSVVLACSCQRITLISSNRTFI